ncbi:MAG: hypothetical protein M3Z25_08730 [Actinomycetota bacterium]|nr:hypothetical protein [Actinomycetota bacterium]
MKLTKLVPSDLADWCKDERTCPAVYDTDGEFAVVQGYPLVDPGVGVPDGEGLVRVPKALLRALAAQLGQL